MCKRSPPGTATKTRWISLCSYIVHWQQETWLSKSFPKWLNVIVWSPYGHYLYSSTCSNPEKEVNSSFEAPAVISFIQGWIWLWMCIFKLFASIFTSDIGFHFLLSSFTYFAVKIALVSHNELGMFSFDSYGKRLYIRISCSINVW